MGTATKPNPLPATQSGRVPVSTRIIIAGTGAEATPVWQNNLGHKVEVVEAKYIPEDDVTGDDTNNFVLSVVNEGTDGTGSTVVVLAKTYASGVDMTQNVADDLPVTAVAGADEVDVDEVLSLVKAITGSGLALPDGVLVLELLYV